ncbi:MAG: PAS domain S-box protein [bacterium]|nr:PAS domain S-box protein [bacterium]
MIEHLEAPHLVLIVDDMPENLRVMSTFLEHEALEIAIAQSGQEALTIVLQDPPDLILLDIMMPVMDGFEVCEHLKNSPTTQEIPIIFLTARTEIADIIRGFECGAVDYVTKPFEPEELAARVFTHLELKTSRDTIKKQNQQLAEQNRELQRLSALQEKTFLTALQESEERFRSTFEQAAVGIAHVAPDGRFLLANQRFCDIVGYAQEQLRQLSFQEITHPEDLDSSLSYAEKMLTGRLQNFSVEKRYIHCDSSSVWVNLTVSLAQESSGQAKYFITVVEDISQRKRAEQALRESEEFHRLTLSSISDAVFITDDRGTFTFICPNVNVIFGYSFEEVQVLGNIENLIGKALFHADELSARQEIANIERKVVDKFGQPHALLVTVKQVSIRTGTLLYSCRDISRRKQTEEALRNSEQQYRLLAESVADGIGIIRNEKWVFVNEALARMLGDTAEALLGKTPRGFLLDDYKKQRQKMSQQLEQKASGAQSWPVLKYVVDDDGRGVWMEERQGFILWQGEPAILIDMRDITRQKLREIEIQEEREHLRRENLQLRSTMKDRYQFGSLIGKSLAMQEVYELILKAAATDKDVLIYGESGTGKELIAGTIHELSKRERHNFVPVNCGAVPETLFEREFFGHRKGAFTGADSDKPGFFGSAHHGTLFLDEVGELSPALQVKLLRAIENGEYNSLGDNRPKTADVRIVAATNRDLKTLVRQGLMREDFFYRIHVIVITVPPLRTRKEDIPLLLEHFLKQYSENVPPAQLPARVLEAFYEYDWPGNVRQLQNTLSRYLTLGRLDFISPRQTDDGLVGDEKIPLPSSAQLSSLHEAVETLERQLILKSLEQEHWHRRHAAEALGIPRKTLFRKMKKYGLT